MKTKAEIDAEKKSAAEAAVRWVRSGMRIGLGSGSTSEHFARALAAALAEGRLAEIVAVPSSERVARLAQQVGVPLVDLEGHVPLDLCVDGADELAPGLQLIKGGGGALLREKVVAAAARKSVIIADSSKVVPRLGKFALPLEVAPFAVAYVKYAVEKLGGRGRIRLGAGTDEPAITDQGLLLLDCHFGDPANPQIENPRELQAKIAGIPGVAGHGLFLDTTTLALVADGEEIFVHTREEVVPLGEWKEF